MLTERTRDGGIRHAATAGDLRAGDRLLARKDARGDWMRVDAAVTRAEQADVKLLLTKDDYGYIMRLDPDCEVMLIKDLGRGKGEVEIRGSDVSGVGRARVARSRIRPRSAEELFWWLATAYAVLCIVGWVVS